MNTGKDGVCLTTSLYTALCRHDVCIKKRYVHRYTYSHTHRVSLCESCVYLCIYIIQGDPFSFFGF